MELMLLESGRRGSRRRNNPPKRLSAYNRFVSRFAGSHPGLEGPDLIERAAAAWRREDNPVVVANNPKKRRTSLKRRNPGTAVANPANTKRRQVRRRRPNPDLPFQKTAERAYGGISMEEGLATGGSVFGTELAGAMISEKFNVGLVRPPDTEINVGYALKKTWPRALAGVLAVLAANAAGLKKGTVQFVGAGAFATTFLQFLGALHIAPEYIKDGSLIIGGGLPPVPPMPQMGPPLPPLQLSQSPIVTPQQQTEVWRTSAGLIAVPDAPSI